MTICLLKSKIHRAVVTGASVEYEGSLTIAADLAERVGLRAYERILVGNMANGERFETYVIPGKAGRGEICLNGPTARKGAVGDRIIIFAYCYLKDAETSKFPPIIIKMDEKNHPHKL